MKIFLEMSSQELLQCISSGALVDLIKEISVVDDTEEKVITMNVAADQIQQEHMEKGEPKVPAKKPAAAETPPAKPKPPEKEQLAEDPKPAEEKKPAPAPAPAKKTGITIEKLQEEAVQLLDGGTGTDRLCTLLTKYGANALPELEPEQYEAFASELKALKEEDK